MIKDIKELNFPQYATLETATATIADMGDRTITSQVKIDGDVVPDFSYDWEVEFKGERYIHPIRKPQGTKENTSMSAKIDMVFQHWAIYEMKRQYFIEMSSTSAGVAVADKYIASLGLNLGDFVVAFNLVLNHYFGDRITIRLNPNWQYDREAKFVSISYSYIWDVLQQIHEIYGVRWTLKTNAEGVCEILMGYPAEEVSHIFEYGFEGGLLSVQRQVQSTDIRNRILGRGGETNLPLRYFKDKDPNNPLFDADPDWVPELANIAFTELRGKTFRDYVKGWKAKHYGGTVMAEPTEAYLAGYNAEKFDPVEYVEDKESIAKYGVLVGALDNNEDIYPSIQGAPNDVDAIVDAEQVTDDDVDSAVEDDSVTTNLESGHQTYRNAPANSTVTIETLTKRYFSVPEGKVGNLSMSLTATGKYSYLGDYEETYPILKSDTVKVTIHDKTTGAEVKSSSVPVVDIPAGDYYYMISADVETNYDRTSMVTLNIESVYLYTSTPNKSEGWSQTFDIWVRNIWGSTRNEGETDKQYADRVWAPILGDRTGGEARVIFASGWLSFSSDWEFPIVGYAYDDSKEGSHWRLTLAKSEAELEASGKYIPYEGYNASAGDRFFFIGIDMPYQYVLWAEERLDDSKRDSLLQTAEINPTWVIKTDKVRLNQDRDGAVLMDLLNAGSQIRLASKQFISGAYETLYVQSLTYNWSADTILYPDVEIVVSDKVYTVKNPVAQIQSNIETIQKQVGSLSNIQQIIRQVCDRLYLRKDGVEDLSKSPTRFLGKVTGDKFRQGQIGGRDWGIYRDENGNAILEADKIVARQGILVSDLVINEAEYVGGLQINSAASMKITAVEETEEGYICYFDQQQGSVTNKFRGDDIALCQKFDVEDNEVKYYKRRVVALTETSVTLSKAEANGTGIPAIDDKIIHYGNYTDKTRQFVIIRDVIGGGYERMLMGLDSVASDGVEYYFAGKSADSEARWFVGGTEQYAEYKNGQLTIKGNLFVAGSNNSIKEQIAQLDFIRESFGENAQGLVLGTAIIVGYNDADGKFVPMAGLSGVFDEYKDNGGPAAWYGGTPDNAKSIIFMDGTGYFADGLFKWDKVKGVDLGDGAIKINYDGSVEFGPNIKISTEGDETLGTVLTAIAKFNSWFEFDEEAKMIKAKYGLYSLGALTAKGKNPSSPGGGGGGSSTLAGLSDVQVGNVQNGQALVYENGYWVPRTVSGGGSFSADAIIDALGYTPLNADQFTKANLGLGNVDNIAANKYFTALSSGTTNAVSMTIGGVTKNITAATLKTSLGLAGLAYQASVPAALGYTPFDKANFTKSNIKSTLGISDWALAATKPSYGKSDVGLDKVDNLAAGDYFTALSSDTTNAISATIGGTNKKITADTLKASLGLGSFAYLSEIPFTSITDVVVSNPSGGQLLAYDAVRKRWVNKTFDLGEHISAEIIVDTLGYEPFDSDAFTKSNIKNALGIADWALAASKPSYTWTDIGSRPTALSAFTNDLGLGSLAYKSILLSSDIPSLPWSKITSGKPTTLSGYGITDAVGYNANIDLASDYKAIGYGYADKGWKGAGPAMVFGTSGYNMRMQMTVRNSDYPKLYIAQSYNGVAKEWAEVITYEDVATSDLNAGRYLSGGTFILHRSGVDTYVNYGNRTAGSLNLYGTSLYFSLNGSSIPFKILDDGKVHIAEVPLTKGTSNSLKAGAYEALNYFADGKLIMHRNAGAENFFLNYGGAAERMHLYGSMYGFHIGESRERAFTIDSNKDASFAANLTVAGLLNSANFMAGGYLTADPTSSFQSSIFGATDSTYRIRTMRSAIAVDRFTAANAPMLTIKTSDTHAFISIGYNTAGKSKCYIGAGINDALNWRGILFHDNMDILPKDNNAFTLGDSSYQWKNVFSVLGTFSNSIKIGDATLTWDATAGMLKIDKGVYSIGAITAGGKGQSNKYRLDEWTEWDASDNKWLESSLSAKLGFELHSRLLVIEESANLGSVTIDLEYILGTPTLTPLQARAAGLTEDVINNLLSGKYTKVISSNALEVWGYTGYSSGSGISLYFTRGDGFIVQSGLKISRASINNDWIVNYNEI